MQLSRFCYNHFPDLNNIIQFLLISLLFFVSCDSRTTRQKIPPLAVNGILDAKDWDFKRDGPLELRGEWKFKWMSADTEFLKTDYNDSDWDVIKNPGNWTDASGKAFGYAWMRLKIINIRQNISGIYLRDAYSAYKLYVNGRMILSNGKAGINRENSVPQRFRKIASLPDGEQLTIAVFISNYHNFYGGMLNCPKIGFLLDLQSSVWQKIGLDLFCLGIICIMTLYHFILWLGRREEKTYLFFSLFCLIIIFRILASKAYLPMLFPELRLYNLWFKIDHLTMSLGMITFTAYLKRLFPQEISMLSINISYIINGTFSALFIFTPSWIFTWLVYPIEIVLSGTLIIVVAVINDIISANTQNYNFDMIHFGLIIYIILQSIVLSKKFTRAFHTAEHLSKNLRKEVQLQTQTISRQNEQLKIADQRKTDFFINLAHEIKTPVTLISNYLNQYKKGSRRKEDLDIVHYNVEKLKNDMVNVLDFVKLERGQVYYNHDQVISFSAILENAVVLFKKYSSGRKLSLNADIEPDVYIKADPNAIERIINNLGDNAVKYNKSEGHINISLKRLREKIIFTVSNTGIGITDNQLENIFKPYYQLSHKKQNLQGIGMGLNIVKKIVEDLDGKVEVTSVPGENTIFTITLSNYILSGEENVQNTFSPSGRNEEISFHTPAKKLKSEERQEGKHSILIVEDNIDMLAYLQESLNHDYNVYCAQNGREALHKLYSIDDLDIIVSDIMMDIMDGYEFKKQVSKIQEFRGIPFIFLTAKTSAGEKLTGLAEGAVDFISKPFQIEELKEKIKSLITMQEASKEKNLNDFKEKINEALANPSNREKQSFNFEQRSREFGLSLREKEILEMCFQGMENKEIAYELGISFHTVRAHMNHIFEKSSAKNKIDLINLFLN